MADTVRSQAFLLTKLQPSQPYPDAQTTALAQFSRDLVTSLPSLAVEVANYNFAAEYPKVVSGGSVDGNRQLTASVSATIRFDRAPDGVIASPLPTGYYLYLVDPNGVSEAVLVTGGTASASVRNNATVTFTPANNHSGNGWYITSASSGWAEQMNSYPTYLSLLPPGAVNLYATLTTPASWAGAVGQGNYNSFVDAYFTGASILSIPALYPYLAGFQIRPRSGNMTAGAAIDLTANSNAVLDHIRVGAPGGGLCCYIGVRATSGHLTVYDFWGLVEYRGFDLTGTSGHLVATFVTSERTNVNYIANSAAIFLSGLTTLDLKGFWHAAGILAYGILIDTNATFVNEVNVAGLYLDNWAIAGIATSGAGGAAATWAFSDFRIVHNGGVAGGRGLLLTGTVDGWSFSAGSILYGDGYGLDLAGSARNVRFAAVTIAPLSTSVGNAAVVASAGSPSLISFDAACNLGVSVDGGAATTTYGLVSSRPIDHLMLRGSVDGSTQANKIVLGGSETNVSIDCDGIGNIRKTLASAAALAFPVMNDQDVIELTGNTGITSVSGLREGQTGQLIATNAAPAGITQGNNIQAPTIANFTRYQVYTWVFTNSLFYLT